MTTSKSKLVLTTLPQKCCGCLTCELRCSLRFEKSFLLAGSAIQVRRTSDGTYQVGFTERCDSCGVCARYCMYGALVSSQREG